MEIFYRFKSDSIIRHRFIWLLLLALLTALFFSCMLSSSVLEAQYQAEDQAPVTSDSFLGFRLASEEEWDALTSSMERDAFDPDSVLYNGADVAFDQVANALYVPQDMTSDAWGGYFETVYGIELVLLEDAYLENKAQALQEGHAFSCLWVIDEASYGLFNVVFTGVPTISLFFDPSETLTAEKESHEGTLVFQDTDGSATVSNMSFHVRGAYSVNYPKWSYKISLKDDTGENRHLSLGGLRSDDDWILNAMYSDDALIREPLAFQAWTQMADTVGIYSATSQGVYVEYFLNDEYMGVYWLQEPVDAKTMDLQEKDVMYKITGGQVGAGEEDLTVYNGELEIDGAKIVWPKEESSASWDILQVCYDYSQGYASGDVMGDKNVTFDQDNAALYDLFVTFLYAYDSDWKNIYLVCRLQADGTYLVSETPWDLNCSFGDTGVGIPTENSSTDTDIHSRVYETYMETCPEEAEQLLCDTWRLLRDGGFNETFVTDKAAVLWSELVGSGAIFREANYWTVDGNDYTQLLTWINERFAAMDARYGYTTS